MINHSSAKQRIMNINIRSVTIDDLNFFTSYILQQEKKDELLGLYKQYYNRIPIGTSMYKVELEIARLERELKELK